MSASALPTDNKLKGKRLLTIGAILALLSTLLVFSEYLFELYIPLYDDIHFGTIFSSLDTLHPYFGIFANFHSVMLDVVLLAIPVVLFLQYLLYGHKLRYGAVYLSLSILTIPLYSFWRTMFWLVLPSRIAFWLCPISTIVLMLPCGFFCLVGAVSLHIPKCGRFIAAASILIALPLAVLATAVPNTHEIFSALADWPLFNSHLFNLFFANQTAVVWLGWLIAATLLFNRLPTLFKTKKKTAAPRVSEEAATEDEAIADEASVVEQSPVCEPAAVRKSDLVQLYKLRANGEISAEEFRILRDELAGKED